MYRRRVNRILGLMIGMITGIFTWQSTDETWDGLGILTWDDMGP